MDAKPIDRATRIVGSQAALARLIGVKPQAVTYWRRNAVPVERCRSIEAATNGAVTVHELRPDVFGPPSADRDA